jgi:chromosome segregation ATPase
VNNLYYTNKAIEELDAKLAAINERLAKAEAENNSYREKIETLSVRLEKFEGLLPKKPEEGGNPGLPMWDWD